MPLVILSGAAGLSREPVLSLSKETCFPPRRCGTYNAHAHHFLATEATP